MIGVSLDLFLFLDVYSGKAEEFVCFKVEIGIFYVKLDKVELITLFFSVDIDSTGLLLLEEF
jgi:hypothetical protein